MSVTMAAFARDLRRVIDGERRQLQALEERRFTVHEHKAGEAPRDVTEENKTQLRRSIAELEALVRKAEGEGGVSPGSECK